MECEGSPLANIPHPALATTQSFDLPKLFESPAHLYFKGQRGAGGPFAPSSHPAFATASSADAKKCAPHTCRTNLEALEEKIFCTLTPPYLLKAKTSLSFQD